jgi:hypothetical protein
MGFFDFFKKPSGQGVANQGVLDGDKEVKQEEEKVDSEVEEESADADTDSGSESDSTGSDE